MGVADIEGRINNFIDVSEFHAYTGDEEFLSAQRQGSILEEEFGQQRPELDEYTKEPPQLPPHLRHIILNKVRLSTHAQPVTKHQAPPVQDSLSLPIPQHVAVNHLY